MSSIAVVTACMGGFDEVRPQVEQDVDCDWFCFTDEQTDLPEPWQLRVEDPRGAHPCLAAKKYKMLPPVPHPWAVWIDANAEVVSRTFVREALRCVHDGLAVFTHPRRDCIYQEAEASLGAESQGGKYDDQQIPEQVAGYRAEGFPEHAGLYACGTLAWDRTDPHATWIGRAWLRECVRWSFQDQLSLPPVLWRLGFSPGVFPFPQLERGLGHFGNRWLRLHPHLS